MKRADRIRIRSAPKIGTSGVHRTVSGEETWQRLQPLIPAIGITRVADITDLDRIGIPTYSAVRPSPNRRTVTVTCGKGTRRIDAKIGAVMESIEYKVGEPEVERCVLARLGELSGNVVHPTELHVPPWVKRADAMRLSWIEGWDILRDEAVWTPAASVYIYEPPGDYLFRGESSGLASGNCIEEAICHGLAELIERDADSISQSYDPLERAYPYLRLESVPASSHDLVERFQRAGVDIYVQNVTSDLGIACFKATCVDRRMDKLLVHGGAGAHLVAELALNRALSEAAQSRAADIQGSREDLSYFRREGRDARRRDPSAPVVETSAWCDFDSVPSRLNSDIADDIAFMVGRLRECGFTRVVIADLTPESLDIPAVRVIVPGIELACTDEWRTGPRLAKTRPRHREERLLQ